LPIRFDSASLARAAQVEWAANRNIEIDPQGYTLRLEDNLFQPLNESTRAELAAGAGDELGANGRRGKMRALHASSALAVNVFDYWRGRACEPLARALGVEGAIDDIQFERTFPTGMQGTPPHLDVTLTFDDGRVIAVESKFLEPYPGRAHPRPFRNTYFPEGAGRWIAGALPACQKIAEALRAGETIYLHLDAQQLLKHALGLANAVGDRYALWYVWYDVGGEDGERHRREIAEFSGCVDASLRFRATSYQDMIGRLADECGPPYNEYISYLRQRYGKAT
jgi:hypothetical protein